MNGAVAEYRLPMLTGLLHHGWRRPGVARDGTYTELDAEVRSGDYFVMLATVLDQLSRKVDDYEAKVSLENIVSDLIYLQDNYSITKTNERSEA